uniref:tRNA-splicing endonuclease subunit Sen34 n=1 Tax=Culicoides sonorensis TaxID=179676 RepID=A0A336KV52_CULSO
MEKIQLTYINGSVFCFNSKDYFKIRETHRVIGSLIGPGIGFTGNKDYKSLPAVFTDIESQFLLEKGIVEVVEKPSLASIPPDSVKNQFQTQFEQQGNEMKSLEDERSMNLFKANIEHIFEGQSKSKTRKQKKSDEEFKPKTIDELIADHEQRLSNTPLKNRLVHIPTANQFEIGYAVSKQVQAKDQFKYRVFRDLWERGHTITCGETFSGDFLCYPGDPLHYHASHIVTILQKDEIFNENQMIVHGRTANTVKKICLFAQEDHDGSIKYHTLNWVTPDDHEMK